MKPPVDPDMLKRIDAARAQPDPGIPHEDYRLLVTAAAMKLSNGKPTTRHYASAKSLVDRSLVSRGVGIVIPSAKPGRVTR